VTTSTDRVAFVTGASSGIGAAVALELARRGFDLVLAARRLERLREVARAAHGLGRRALEVGCDVTRDGELEAAAQLARQELGRIDVVIANAGFGVASPLRKLSLDDYRRQLETNVFGVLRTVYATLDDLAASIDRLHSESFCLVTSRSELRSPGPDRRSRSGISPAGGCASA
jgi:NADP-dependent 3-hydroxy acid dehydrogenase YdfG